MYARAMTLGCADCGSCRQSTALAGCPAATPVDPMANIVIDDAPMMVVQTCHPLAVMLLGLLIGAILNDGRRG